MPDAAPEPLNETERVQPQTQRLTLPGVALVPLLLAAACASPSPHRADREFASRWAEVRTVTLIPPKIAVFAMSAGGVEEEVLDWTEHADRQVSAAIEQEVSGRLGRTFVPYAGRLSPHGLAAPTRNGKRERYSEAEQAWLLFEAVKDAALRHTYDPAQTFPTRLEDFGYTLGPGVQALLDGTEADACVLAIAGDHVATADRAALIAAGVVTAPLTLSYAGPAATPANLVLAVVDTRSGEILFFSNVSMPSADLRSAEGSGALVATAMKGMSR